MLLFTISLVASFYCFYKAVEDVHLTFFNITLLVMQVPFSLEGLVTCCRCVVGQ